MPAGQWPLLICVLTFLVPSMTYAQAARADLVGLIVDDSRAPIEGAAVTLTHLATGSTRTTVTRQDGLFTFVALPPGDYRLETERTGFRRSMIEPVHLATGERARVDVVLHIGVVNEAIDVVAPQPLLQSESGGLGFVVEARQISALPLNGRNFVQLAALVPGVSLPPNSSFPRINGGRPRTNEYLFDGVSVLQPEPGQVAFLPIIEAIDEFKVETNSPAAEFGRFNGGVVNLTTRAGTNQPRATAFEFFRNQSLNARNAFAPRELSPDKPPFRRHQFGAVGGGPIVMNRTFVFAGYQGSRHDIGRVRISTVPTSLQRQGIFTEPVGGRTPVIYDPATTQSLGGGVFARDPFRGNVVPTARMDPIALALLHRFPMPTSPGTASNYQRIGTETQDQNQFDVRLDHVVKGAGRIFSRLSVLRDVTVPVSPLPDGSGSLTGVLGPTQTRGFNIVANYLQPIGQRATNELRIGDTGRSVDRTGVLLDGAVSSPGVPGLPPNAAFVDALPTFAISGYQTLGSPAGTNTGLTTRVYQVVDVLAMERGRHLWKAGIDFRWHRLDIVQPPSPTGSFTFTSLFTDLPGRAGTGSPLASFLLGQVQTFSIDVQRDILRPRAASQEYFVQDDWTPSNHLTVNLGLRYTLDFPSTEASNQGAVFNLASQQLDFLGRDGYPRSGRDLRKNNFGPRFGAAYRFDDRTVVRSGYGLVWIELAGITTPFVNPQFPFLQTVSQRSLDNINAAFTLSRGPGVAPLEPTPDAGLGQGVFTVDRDLGAGYVQQWNIALERQLGSSFTIEIAYAGSTITRLGLPDTNINQLSVDQLALGPALVEAVPNPFYGDVPQSSSIGGQTIPRAQLLRPFPRFTTVSYYRNNVGSSHYHAAQLRVEKRFAKGLAFGLSYTRSKLLDDASSVFDATVLTGPVANYPVADTFNRTLERDVSNGDTPNNLVATVTFELPWGQGRRWNPGGVAGAAAADWTLSAVVSAQSGLPLAVTQATNFNAFAGFGVQRPNRVRDPGLPSDERSRARWFDIGAFETAPQFTLGTSSRNPVRGPAYRNVDLVVSRRVAVGRTSLELRVEAFNALNTPALGAPNTVLGTAGFGSITSAGDPRVIQLGVRVNY
jgi:hypothetical protein